MTDENRPSRDERNEPNEFGFAGAATAPQPRPGPQPSGVDGEDVAVPSGDLTGAVADAIEDRTARDSG